MIPENSRLPGFIHLVTELSSFSQSSPTKPPVATFSARSPFISFSAETLSIFTKLKCGGDSPLGNSTFIILDKHTASGSKSCIVAVNNYYMEPGYQLLRCDFKNALSIAYIGDDGYGPAFQDYCESAAMECDGVYRT